MTKSFDVRSEFDIYQEHPDLVYLDSASTTLVPRSTIQATNKFLTSTVVSSRKGAHRLAVKGSEVVESTRKKLAEFFSTSPSQLSFQKSLPCAVASLAFGYDWKGQNRNKIVLAQSEENSVYVSLLRAAQILNLKTEIIPIDKDGILDLNRMERVIDDKTGIVAVGHVSAGIGNQNPIHIISNFVKPSGAILLSDATRSIGFTDTKPSKLGADIVLFSGNIGLMGPPGLTIQWANTSLLENHIPGVVGGSSVSNVSDTSFDVALNPDKFESGYINVPAIAGLGASIDFLARSRSRGMYSYISKIAGHVLKVLNELSGITIYGSPNQNNTIFGFNVAPDAEISCHDISLFLDESNIAVRSGLICAHPLVRSIHSDGILQVSIHAYNTLADINQFAEVLATILTELT
jgi:cysteine desulfurase/selenocysteine lyase